MSNDNNVVISNHIGILDFENYWGEKLIKVEITHYISSFFNDLKSSLVHKIREDIDDKTKFDNFMSFSYSLGDAGNLDYWIITFVTESMKIYSTKGGKRCSITSEDEGKVILGVNGESEKMYISMASGSCSTRLERIG